MSLCKVMVFVCHCAALLSPPALSLIIAFVSCFSLWLHLY